MRKNLPVTGREYIVPPGTILVSSTDLKSRITHCNRAFVEVSGYEAEELLGQPHNMIRHPDMPQEGFRDLWDTIDAGKPWTALVKNRRKNGDHYWVRANVTPIMDGERITGYLSVRTIPSREEVAATEPLYAAMREAEIAGNLQWRLEGGFLYPKGSRGELLQAWRWCVERQRAAWYLLLVLLPLAIAQSAGVWLAAGIGGAAALVLAHLARVREQAPLERAIGIANRLAAGDLSQRVLASRDDLEGRMLRALNQVGVNLFATISDARAELQSMMTAASEIARGNEDLSARTENTASNLEETAAAMHQLASSARNSAETVQRCADNTSRTLQSVRAGADSVQAMGQAMEIIAESSGRISGMVDLINQITFQTNLLALNAAVEAARAGDSGRGFAVVAGEVRSLASRTATASNEIRDLVRAATESIEAGSDRANRAGSAMQEVRGTIDENSQLVSSILTVVDEEMNGIAQVNEAVTQIDQLTQQNAAMVEELAAAAQALREQCGAVMESMSVFRLKPVA
jgi:aerotaxis receptor